MTELVIALISGGAAFAGSWAGMRVHIFYLRRDVDRAHRRLDAINAPACTTE